MTTKEELHVGDFGTSFVLTIRRAHDNKPLDVSEATSKKVLFRHQDGTVDEFMAMFVTDGRDGDIVYVTEEGDIGDEPQELEIRAEVTLAGAHYESSTRRVTVHARWTV